MENTYLSRKLLILSCLTAFLLPSPSWGTKSLGSSDKALEIALMATALFGNGIDHVLRLAWGTSPEIEAHAQNAMNNSDIALDEIKAEEPEEEPEEDSLMRPSPFTFPFNSPFTGETILPATDNNCALVAIYGRNDITRAEVTQDLLTHADGEDPLSLLVRELMAVDIMGHQREYGLVNRGRIDERLLNALPEAERNDVRSVFQAYFMLGQEARHEEVLRIFASPALFRFYVTEILGQRIGDNIEDPFPMLGMIRGDHNPHEGGTGATAAIAAMRRKTLLIYERSPVTNNICPVMGYRYTLGLSIETEAPIVDIIITTADPVNAPHARNHFNRLNRVGSNDIQPSEELQSLFSSIKSSGHNMIRNLDNPELFNIDANTLREYCSELLEDQYAGELPDGFALRDLYQSIFDEAIVGKAISDDQINDFLKADDERWNAYDSFMIGMILNGIKNFNGIKNYTLLRSQGRVVELNTRLACYFSPFQTEQAKGKPTFVGAGSLNSVYQIEYTMGLPEDIGSTAIKIFKPTAAAPGQRWIERNLATYNLDQYLNTGVIVDTHPALHEGQVGIVMEYYGWNDCNEKHFTVKPLSEIIVQMNDQMKNLREQLSKNAQFIKAFCSLRALDYLSGQIDRPAGGNNILVLFDTDQDGNLVYKGLKGIDNDLSWQITALFEDLVLKWRESDGYIAAIDIVLAERILNMTAEDMAAIGDNLLTEIEKSQAQERLQTLQNKIRSGVIPIIVKDEDWGSIQIDGIYENPGCIFIDI